MAKTSDSDEAAVNRLVVAAGRRLAEREPEISAAISTHLAAIEGLAIDQQMYDLMAESTHANVTTVFHLATQLIAPEDMKLPKAASSYIEMLAQRGTRAHVLVRAYHRGQDLLKEYFFDEVELLEADPELKLRAVHHLTDLVYRWVDQTTQRVLDIHEAEQRRWNTAAGNVTTAMVHGLLSGNADVIDFERETGYRVDRHHVAVVLWIEGDRVKDSLRELEAAGRRLALATSGRNGLPLFSAVDTKTAWLWLPRTPGQPPLATDAVVTALAKVPGGRAAIGLPAGGEAGFRASHDQAAAARELSLVSQDSSQVVGYGDPGVAVISMLSRDLDGLRAWVHATLGGLAVDTEASAPLRETLLRFVATGCNFGETAEQMVLHRNTVRYRVERAIEVRGRPLTDDLSDLATALQAARLLGTRILCDER